MDRIRATHEERVAQLQYASVVMADALHDAQQKIDGAYESWTNRVITDHLVVLERKAIYDSVHSDIATNVKNKWNYHRAEAIYKADQAALKAAWPLGDK